MQILIFNSYMKQLCKGDKTNSTTMFCLTHYIQNIIDKTL